jgi:Xaa-Pro aminopeptidase
MTDVLMYADTLRSPELRHEVPARIIDPFLYAEHEGATYAVLSQLDADGARAARADLQVIEPERLGLDELLAAGTDAEEALVEIAVRACLELGVDRAVVPPRFPLELADRLRAEGIELTVDRNTLTERRRVKSQAELEGIRRALLAAEAGMATAAGLLRETEARNGALFLDGEPLTCERIKAAIRATLSERGAIGEDMIVSQGAQTAIGHDRGSGPIAAGEPVIVDLWPMDSQSGCYADMTRTFVVGDPGEQVRAWHSLCVEALERVVREACPGVSGRAPHELVCDLFHEHGYPTQLLKRPGEVLRDGFFHALGHGVGLEPHEAPNVGRSKTDQLVSGDVLAIEPGLYRHGYGGCRVEDLVRVGEDGAVGEMFDPDVIVRPAPNGRPEDRPMPALSHYPGRNEFRDSLEVGCAQ